MKEQIIKWITDNSEDVKYGVYTLIVLNLLILGIIGPVWFFFNVFSILFSNACFVVPLILLIKFIRKELM